MTYFLLIIQMYPPSPDIKLMLNQQSPKVSTEQPPTTGVINNATTNFV